jgi:3-phenylpropionate/cinnamic acid dioxygenase small subunit
MIGTPSDILIEREAIRDLIQLSGALIDDERFEDWLALFTPDGRYELFTASPELRGLSPWLNVDRPSLAVYLGEMDQRVRYRDQRRHLIAPVRIALQDVGATVESHLAVFRTDPEGRTQCEASGRYVDTLVRRDDGWRIARRRVELDTHIHPGHHVPL